MPMLQTGKYSWIKLFLYLQVTMKSMKFIHHKIVCVNDIFGGDFNVMAW